MKLDKKWLLLLSSIQYYPLWGDVLEIIMTWVPLFTNPLERGFTRGYFYWIKLTHIHYPLNSVLHYTRWPRRKLHRSPPVHGAVQHRRIQEAPYKWGSHLPESQSMRILQRFTTGKRKMSFFARCLTLYLWNFAAHTLSSPGLLSECKWSHPGKRPASQGPVRNRVVKQDLWRRGDGLGRIPLELSHRIFKA